MNLPALKASLLSALPTWIDNQINSLTQANPAMTVVSAYLKRGAHNYLTMNQERIGNTIDQAAMFIASPKGDINIDTIFDDLISMFKAMPEYPFDFGLIHGTVGKGEIRISLPDSILSTILFGNMQSVRLRDTDLLKLKELLKKPQNI